jgi:hypothetical protein
MYTYQSRSYSCPKFFGLNEGQKALHGKHEKIKNVWLMDLLQRIFE